MWASMSERPAKPASRTGKVAVQFFVDPVVNRRFRAALGFSGQDASDAVAELMNRWADSLGIPRVPPPADAKPRKR